MCRDEKSEVHVPGSCGAFLFCHTIAWRVRAREFRVSLAAWHPICLFVFCLGVHLPRRKNITKPQDPTASLQQVPPRDLMADLKRSRDSSSHGPSKLPRLSSFHPDEDLDNPMHTFVGRYMGMMRDRQKRYNTLLAFASDDNTEFQEFHAKVVDNERRLEQALAPVFEMTFSVHEELEAIENYELPRAVSSGPQWYRRGNILGMFHSKVHCQTLTPDIRPQPQSIVRYSLQLHSR